LANAAESKKKHMEEKSCISLMFSQSGILGGKEEVIWTEGKRIANETTLVPLPSDEAENLRGKKPKTKQTTGGGKKRWEDQGQSVLRHQKGVEKENRKKDHH